jgi:endonuclease III
MISTDQAKLTQAIKQIAQARDNRQGIFSRKWWWGLPTHNLPDELEHPSYFQTHDRPPEVTPRDPVRARQFIFTRMPLESGIRSVILVNRMLELWYDKSANWFFDPTEVAAASDDALNNILIKRIGYGRFTDQGPAILRHNANLLLERYDGDPGNVVNGKSVEEAVAALTEFKRIGPGIARLVLTEFLSRGLTTIPDHVEKLSVKIDIHKARLAANVMAVDTDGYLIHHNTLEKLLPRMYLQAFNELNITAEDADELMWLIPSQLCSKQSHIACLLCPIKDLCERNVFYKRQNATRYASRRRRASGHIVFWLKRGKERVKADARETISDTVQIELFQSAQTLPTFRLARSHPTNFEFDRVDQSRFKKPKSDPVIPVSHIKLETLTFPEFG